MRHLFIILAVSVAVMVAIPVQSRTTIELPAPHIRSGVMRALERCATIRAFRPEPLPMQTIAELCWAAFGISDRSKGRRTAASAFGAKEIQVYILLESGAWQYDARNHALVQVADSDIRGTLGTQEYANYAPVHLVYVADYNRSRAVYPEWAEHNMAFYSAMHAGLSMQNVHLYCAAKGLATVVRDVANKADLAAALGLEDGEDILISQPVGWPR